MMELQGLGMEDAAKALVVSKAVRRAMKEQGFSAIEAIDDLTAKLCVANLLQSESPEKQQQEQQHAIRQSTPVRRAAPSLLAVSQRKPSARKMVKSKFAKASGNKVETTNKPKNPRKRAASSEVETKTSRARADSVAEEVNAKIQKQQPEQPKGKRDGPPVPQQPPSKRPREA
jgi:hypothetical protein